MNKTAIIALLICTVAIAQQKSKADESDWGVQTGPPVRSIAPYVSKPPATAEERRKSSEENYTKATGFRVGVFKLTTPWHCFYDDKDGTWYMKPDQGWTMEGHYDLKGETKGKIRDVKIIYYTEYNATLNAYCTVQPEWGNSYIDKECMKKQVDNFKEDLYNVVYKNKFEGKNVYKICANNCGGGLGYCDESMYW